MCIVTFLQIDGQIKLSTYHNMHVDICTIIYLLTFATLQVIIALHH